MGGFLQQVVCAFFAQDSIEVLQILCLVLQAESYKVGGGSHLLVIT